MFLDLSKTPLGEENALWTVIQRVSFEVDFCNIVDRANAGSFLVRGQSRRRPLHLCLAPFFVLLRDCLASRACGLLETLSLVDEFADVEFRRFTLAFWFVDRHYLPPFFVAIFACLLPLRFGRPPNLAHSLNCFLEWFAARALPPS